MNVQGSCACGAVRFSLQTRHPVPYQRCYCSICRKTAGGGGYCINTSGDASSLEVEGRDHVRVFQAPFQRNGRVEQSKHERHFCGECGSHLWAWHPDWPELIHPVAGALDTPFSPPPENVHLMVGSKASWVEVEGKKGDAAFDGYPSESIADFHRARAWEVD